jgi:outer membrane protein OmpA-like peptidoglycan-associated protein
LFITHQSIMKRLKRTPLSAILMLALAVVVATGCQSLSNTEKGAAIGTGTGGAAGAAIGKAVGGTAEGAIIGAVVGGAAGAIIGQRMDRKAEELEQELANADVERIGEGIVVTFDSGLLFDFDSSALRSGARQDLQEFATSMKDYPETEILVVGHTDSKGSADYNQDLSERRAGSAADYLINQGISADRLRTEGRGETEPVATNDTEAGRQQNRRVEVAIFASEEYREDAKSQAAN